tara:strand:- start:418 stop:675 length:258 start_codon:yes stop_codon:yes gene_type:complete
MVKEIMIKKITIELDSASDAQLKSFLADVSLSMEPWHRFVRFKIKNGKKVYKHGPLTVSQKEYDQKRKLQAASAKRPASSVKLQA